MTILSYKTKPSNAEIREMAIDKVPLKVGDGEKHDYLVAVLEEYLRLQHAYFPMFCEDTRIANITRDKETEKYGYRTPTRMVGGKVYDGTTGWSKNKHFKEKWIISSQLRSFMCHIYPSFWEDENAGVRNGFMKGVLKGDDSYTLLGKVYTHYGANIEKPLTEEAVE